jgi:hypothetical protein
VRRFCPPPDILVPQLETLFASWKDVQCSLDPTRGPLFSDSAQKQAKLIIRVAQLGLISDPPGYALYYKMGVDPDGLPYYRCVRGTNSVEGGIHMVIRRTFGSLRASPELSDALLCNIRHRQNAHVGYFNKTGKHWKSHYDDWKRDEIVELAAEAGIAPSFPIPDVLATRVVTDETFGTIAIPDSLIAQYHLQPSVTEMSTPHLIDNIPAHLTTKLSTKPLSSYMFLAKCQKTMHAVVPIHTSGEYNLFNHLLGSGLYFIPSNKAPAAANTARLVDFNKLTIKWNEIVDERAVMIPDQNKVDKIYYKLPEQLERHHKLWVQARGTRATLVNTTKARSGITRILSDPTHVSHVLPAILPEVGVKGTTRITIPLPTKTYNVSPISDIHMSDVPSVAGSSTAGSSHQAAVKKRSERQCASCRDHKCNKASTCAGRGGRSLCKCTDHPIVKNPCARTS